eukprot:1152129-Pelagomonas_calceolata.AAC.1
MNGSMAWSKTGLHQLPAATPSYMHVHAFSNRCHTLVCDALRSQPVSALFLATPQPDKYLGDLVLEKNNGCDGHSGG